MGRRRKRQDDAPKEVKPPVANRVVARIEEWAVEAAASFELEFYDLNVTKQWVIQVYVDRYTIDEGEEGTATSVGVAVQECANVSRYMEALLDADEDVWTKYTIEVSSPGIERKLTRPRHYELSVGQNIKLVVGEPIDGETKFTGALQRFEQDVAYVALDEKVLELPFDSITKARIAYEF